MDAKIYVSLLVCLLGLVLYLVLTPKPKGPAFAEVARVAYAMGLLATLLLLGGKAVHLP